MPVLRPRRSCRGPDLTLTLQSNRMTVAEMSPEELEEAEKSVGDHESEWSAGSSFSNEEAVQASCPIRDQRLASEPDKRNFTIKSLRYYHNEEELGRLNDNPTLPLHLTYAKTGNKNIFYPEYLLSRAYKNDAKFADFVLNDQYGPLTVSKGRGSLRFCKKKESGGIKHQLRIRFASVSKRDAWVAFFLGH